MALSEASALFAAATNALAPAADAAAPATDAAAAAIDAAAALDALRLLLPCGCLKCAFRTPGAEAAIRGQPEERLLRFLAGSTGDSAKAAHLLTDAQLWRDSMRADDVLQDVVALANERRIRRYYAYALHGTDLEGNALYIERLGDLDAQALLDDFEIEVLERNHVLSNERCAAVSQKRTVVMDAAGLGSKTLAGLHVLKAFIAIDERYYPETLRRCLIVNAPWVVHATYALVRPWLDAVTAEKIQIVSTSETSDTLLKYIAREQLPDFLGGECKCEKGCVPKAENETTAGH